MSTVKGPLIRLILTVAHIGLCKGCIGIMEKKMKTTI